MAFADNPDNPRFDRAIVSAEVGKLIVERGLESLTSKQIRKHLEEVLHCPLKDYREQIDQITREQIDLIAKSTSKSKEEEGKNKDHVSDDPAVADEEEESFAKEPESSAQPSTSIHAAVKRAGSPIKEREDSSSGSDEEEDMVSSIKRRRMKREPPKKSGRVGKKKTANGLKGKSAYSRICVLSEELSSLLNTKYSTRSGVVKAMWAYFREHELFDPRDKRWVILNEPLRRIFTGKRTKAFSMMKTLRSHIKDAEFLDEATKRQAERDIAAQQNVAGDPEAEEEESSGEEIDKDGPVSESSDED